MDLLGGWWSVLTNGGGAALVFFGGLAVIVWFWLHSLVEALRRQWPSPSDRTTWVLLIVLLPVLGVILYRALVPAPTARPTGR